MKFSYKILISILLLLGTIVLSTSLFLGYQNYTQLAEEFKSKGKAIAKSISDASTEILLTRDVATVQAIIDQFLEIKGVSYVFVQNAEGEIISHTFVPSVPAVFLKDTVIPTSDAIIVNELSIMGLGSVIDIASPILAGQVGLVHVGMDKDLIISAARTTIIKGQLVILSLFILSLAIAYFLIKQISEYIKETTQAKERIESELTIARGIQRNILPKTFPPFPARSDFDIHGEIEPAREVGGDFFDFFLNEEKNLLCFTIGDVSGKGIAASLFMAVTATLIKATGNRVYSPSEVMRLTNQSLAKENERLLFVTTFYGVLDLNTGHLNYCLAGHHAPILVTGSDAKILPLTGDIALGIDPTATFKSASVTLSPNDTILLYTDGVTEAQNETEAFYSQSRLEDTIKQTQDTSPKAIIDAISTDVNHFSGKAPQSDDITLLAVQYLGSTLLDSITLTIPNSLTEIQHLHKEVEALSHTHNIPEKTKYNLDLALEEIVTNIISYGYSDQNPHEISITIAIFSTQIQVEIIDDAKPFNPLLRPDPDTQSKLSDRPIGGLGIHLVKTLTTACDYKREKNKNHLRITLGIEPTS